MAVRFVSVQTFPFSLHRLWTSCATADYAVRKYMALGATDVRVHRFEADGEAIDVELVRDVPVRAETLPEWSRRWAPKRQMLRHRTLWQRSSHRHAVVSLSVVPLRLPVRVDASGTLDEKKGETRMELSWRVKASVPGLSSALERLFEHQVQAGLEEDRAFTVRYVAEHAGRAAVHA